MAEQEITVPDLGDVEEVEIIEVLVKVGDTVSVDDPLVTLESDKATMDVPALAAATIAEMKVSEGDSVAKGDVIATLEGADAGGAPAQSEQRVEETEQAGPPGEKAGDAGGESTEIKVPELGDVAEAEIIEVLVKAGDTVAKEDPLITLESDKARMDVPSTAAGTIEKLQVKEGDKVSEGDVILILKTAGGGSEQRSEKQPKAPAQKQQESPSQKAAPQPQQPRPAGAPPSAASTPDSSRLAAVDESAFFDAHASPAVRRFARQLGVDLGRVAGSGRKERILHEDVERYARGVIRAAQDGAAGGTGLPAMPEEDFSRFGAVEEKPLPRIRRLSAANVHRNWLVVPHVTQFDADDVTELEAFRKAENERGDVKLTPLAFIVKACVAAIDRYPEFASSLAPSGETLIMKHFRHIGFAADTEHGLLVPVIHDVDKKGLRDVARETAELAEKARAGQLKGADMRGSVFSISSLGGIGGTAFTPIVNAPDVAILGVSRTQTRPVWDGQQFVPRLMLPLSLSYDHRVIDGAKAARFTRYLAGLLSDVRRLVL